MPNLHWGSLILGLIIGIMLYHFSKNRMGAGV